MTLDEWLTMATQLAGQHERLETLRAYRAARPESEQSAWDDEAAVWPEEAKKCAEQIGYAGDLDGALEIVAAVYPVAALRGDIMGEALLLRAWANVLQVHEQYEECLTISQRAVDIYEAQKDEFNVAVARMVQVGALGALERFDEALALAEEIRPRFVEADFWLGQGRLANAVARLYVVLGRFDEALAEYEFARRVYLEDRRAGDAAWVLHNIGHLWLRRDDPERACTILEQVYSELKDNDPISAIKCQFNLARARTRQGRFDTALAHLSIARRHLTELAEKAGSAAETLPDKGYVDQLEASIRFHLHELKAAETLLREALDLFSRLRRQLETAETLVELARLQIAGGLPERIGEGLDHLERAAAELAGLPVPLLAAWVKLEQSEALLRRGSYRQAAAAAGEVSDIFRRSDLRLRLAQALAVRADCWRFSQPDEARSLYDEALALAGEGALLLAARCWHGLGRIHLDAGAPEAAEAALLNAVAVEETLRRTLRSHLHKAGFLAGKGSLHEELLAAIQRQPQSEGRLLGQLERLKAGALVDLLQDQPPDRSLDDALRERLAERDRLAALLDFHLSPLGWAGAESVADDGRRGALLSEHDEHQTRIITGLRRQLQIIEEDIFRRDPTQSWRGATVISPQEIHALLDEQSILITYFTTSDGLAAMTTGAAAGDVRLHRLSGSPADLHTRWRVCQERLGDANAAHTCLAVFYDRLIRPLEERLAGKRRLIIAPHQQLSLLPFAAFFDKRRHAYLLERWTTQLTPSATIFALCRQRAVAGEGVLLVGYPGSPDDPTYLLGVIQEIDALRARMPGALCLTGDEATEANVLRHVAGKRIVHLAGHAYFMPHQPLDSGMPLAGGPWLRASDLYLNYDLMRGATVVLSGCQTGAGRLEGGEVLGLQSAFLYAGARNIVSSLWKVDDTATAILMSDYYDGLVNGSETGEALRLAQLQMLGGERYRAPDYWGAFQLIGAGEGFDGQHPVE